MADPTNHQITLAHTHTPLGGFPKVNFTSLFQPLDNMDPGVRSQWCDLLHPKALILVFGFNGDPSTGCSHSLLALLSLHIWSFRDTTFHAFQFPPAPHPLHFVQFMSPAGSQ